MKNRHAATGLFVVPALLFTLLVFAFPLLGVVSQSMHDAAGAFTLSAYVTLFHSELFYRVAWNTLCICIATTLITLVLAYPLAYYLAGLPARRRSLVLILVLVPFWTSILVKSFAFTVLLGQGGVLNQLLGMLGVPTLKLVFNRIGVIVGMSHFLIPFMVFPILSSLLARPPELTRAARIMGASNTRIFFRIVLPLSIPGVAAGTLIVLILSLGFFIVPALLGGRKDMMLGNLIDFYTRQILNSQMASAISVLLLVFAALAAIAMSKLPGGGMLADKEAAHG